MDIFWKSHNPTTLNKQGMFTPGKHIPIISPKKGLNDTVDYAFLGAWNFEKEIKQKEKKGVLVPMREKELLNRLRTVNKGPMADEMVIYLFQQIIDKLKDLQK